MRFFGLSILGNGIAFFVSLGFFSPFAFSHSDPNAPVPAVHALKIDTPITIDGRLDEPVWQDADVATNFIDMRTQKLADQQSTVRILYDNENLYIGMECLDDNMGAIHASERREDRDFSGDDWVEVHLDPTHSHRAKYAFFTNPLGTRRDASEGPSGVFNTGWTSSEWSVAATQQEDRWVFEMSIPFSIMNYYREDGQTWGLNFTRMLRRTDVTSFWSFHASDIYKPRFFGHLTGLDLAQSQFDRNLEITPYVSSRVDFNSDVSTYYQTGVDTSFRLTPSITTSWTINPDFGQVESDDDTIELRDTERFLSEKRLFFREGEELLSMKQQLYYSRRFTNIDAGAKVSGDWNNYKFYLLNIQGETVHDGSYSGNSTVFRTLQNVGDRSTLGYYFSNSEMDDGHSRVASLDGDWIMSDEWRYRFQTSLSDDRLEDGGRITKDRFDYLGYSSLLFTRYPWEIDMGYNAISKEFNPLLGYIPRNDIYGPFFRTTYSHQSDVRWYKSLYVNWENQLYENDEGRTTLRDYSLYSKVIFHNDIGVSAGQSFDYHAPYDNRRTEAGVSFFSSDFWKEIGLIWAGGEFEKTDYNELTLEKNFKPFERWPIRYDFTIRLEDQPDGQQDTVWLNRIVFDYYFTDKMWIKTSLQHRNNSVHNISVIYGWEFIHNAHWYLVYNGLDDGEDSGNSFFTKIDYTF